MLEAVRVTGNVKTVTLKVKQSPSDPSFKDLNNYVDVDAHDLLRLQHPTAVISVRVVLTDPDEISGVRPDYYEVELEIFACFKYSKFISN